MKTRDRILAAARALFNSEGFGALSALDIATSMGISPGHLYYHFKGKLEIASVLLKIYENETGLVLQAALEECTGPGATLEVFWTHIHILVEEAWDVRFLYREAGALVLGQPDLAAKMRRIVTAERAALGRMLNALSNAGAIAAAPEILDGFSRTLVTGIGFHALELELEGDPGPPRELVARTAAQVMLPLATLARKKRR